MPKISVIIPVYNAEKFIEKCISSIVLNSMVVSLYARNVGCPIPNQFFYPLYVVVIGIFACKNPKNIYISFCIKFGDGRNSICKI